MAVLLWLHYEYVYNDKHVYCSQHQFMLVNKSYLLAQIRIIICIVCYSPDPLKQWVGSLIANSGSGGEFDPSQAPYFPGD